VIRGEQKWLWFLQIERVPPPNSGVADALEEEKAQFKRSSGATIRSRAGMAHKDRTECLQPAGRSCRGL
jgi:hypothetical protein